jgi:predicted TIM-barrel fold metal-dependent hydrolase
VLLKWLPIVQGFNPADKRCFPFYEALAHYKLPLLAHTGGEKSLIRLNDEYADPKLLEQALQRGVTVIAAHCGTRSAPFEPDYYNEFVRLLHRYENLYGDTAALNLPTRMRVYEKILKDPFVMSRLVHGSDWPIIAFPPPIRLGAGMAIELMHEKNWMRRDFLVKQQLGFDREYFERGAKVLRLG